MSNVHAQSRSWTTYDGGAVSESTQNLEAFAIGLTYLLSSPILLLAVTSVGVVIDRSQSDSSQLKKGEIAERIGISFNLSPMRTGVRLARRGRH